MKHRDVRGRRFYTQWMGQGFKPPRFEIAVESGPEVHLTLQMIADILHAHGQTLPPPTPPEPWVPKVGDKIEYTDGPDSLERTVVYVNDTHFAYENGDGYPIGARIGDPEIRLAGTQ